MTSTGNVASRVDGSVSGRFRDAMASVCTPVAVVTAMDGDRPHGTTVSAVMSLSMTPPMIAVALDNNSELLGIIRETGNFGVNVLTSVQAKEASIFAGKGHDKFDGVGWTLSDGSPRLAYLSSWTACQLASFVAGGDHTILMGTVVAADSAPDRPLTYHRRQFGTHSVSALRPRSVDAH